MLITVPLLVLAQTTAPSTEPAAVGSPAPEFTLPDLDGGQHRLSDQRGRIVVLEWTSHLCPAVARANETRLLQDTRAAVASDDVLWWQIDSSWFAPEFESRMRAWCARSGFDGPLLCDPDGAVARAYGARATPQLFVIDPEGRLAYSGILCDRGDERERRNYVVETVAALLAGEDPETSQTEPRGCSVKLVRARDASAASFDEDGRAEELYTAAAGAAGATDWETALEHYREAVEAGLPTPWRLVSDPAFRPVMARPEARDTLRRLLGDRPQRGVVTLVAPDEPGDPMVLTGTVRDAAGTPIEGALVSLYHTDEAGYYSERSIDASNPRLFGRVATDSQGRYRIRTIVPGHYANSDVPLHVHIGYRATDFVPHEGHRASIYFADDPQLTGAALAEIRGDDCTIAVRERNAEGVTLVVNDVTLTRE